MVPSSLSLLTCYFKYHPDIQFFDFLISMLVSLWLLSSDTYTQMIHTVVGAARRHVGALKSHPVHRFSVVIFTVSGPVRL